MLNLYVMRIVPEKVKSGNKSPVACPKCVENSTDLGKLLSAFVNFKYLP